MTGVAVDDAGVRLSLRGFRRGLMTSFWFDVSLIGAGEDGGSLTPPAEEVLVVECFAGVGLAAGCGFGGIGSRGDEDQMVVNVRMGLMERDTYGTVGCLVSPP